MPLNIPQEVITPSVSRKKVLFRLIVAIILLAMIIPGYILFKNLWPGLYKPNYTEVYRLVNEKVSANASIAIHLPSKMPAQTAQTAVKFEPEIEGRWISSPKEGELLYKPKSALTIGHHYQVSFAIAGAGEMKEDFLAAPDPEIVAVFPKSDSEAPENSEITIVFSRPMVPLSTLGYIDNKNDVPVKITPETKGKFKWTSTSNLQFIPESNLIGSADYEVKINSGFTSMDGLSVKGLTHKFTTRELRYQKYSEGDIIYNQPISLYFNQDVNLEKTKGQIVLRDETTGQNISFLAEYHKKTKADENEDVSLIPYRENDPIGGFISNTASIFNLSFGSFSKSSDSDIDKSRIDIFNVKDRFGRKKLWDFDHKYSLKVSRVYPINGNIEITSAINPTLQVGGPIAKIIEKSDRTSYAAPDFFDPKGKLYVYFHEDFDLSKSKINVPKASEIKYAEKCKDKYLNALYSDCDREDDKKTIEISFKDNNFSPNEKFEISFDKIVNSSGLVINRDPVKQAIVVYPSLRILKTNPYSGIDGASVETFVLCTSTPLAVPAKEDYKKFIKANADYDVRFWGQSRKIEASDKNPACQVGEFKTEIGYGLMPQNQYSLNMNVVDSFDQKNDLSLDFKTGDIPNNTVSIFELQNDRNVTSPEKTKLAYAAKNIEYVNVSICKLPALKFLSYVGGEQYLKDTDSPSAISGCEKTANDKIALPKKYWINNYFNIDIKTYFPDAIGNYIVTVSHPQFTTSVWSSSSKNYTYQTSYSKTYLSVTNLAVGEKRISPMSEFYSNASTSLSSEQKSSIKNIYWVTNISDLSPVGQAEVKLYKRVDSKGISLEGTYSTGSDGVATANIFSDPFGAIITKGKDSAVITKYRDNLDWAGEAQNARDIYLYTNKPIYRPGDEVNLRGIYRIGYDGNYQIDNSQPVKIKVRNSKYDIIIEKDLSISDFGTFSSTFTIDKNASLGQYNICAFDYNCVSIDVEEYVPASFEVKVNSDKEEYISKDTANLEINANYYFGVPVENGEVSYTVSSQNYYFDRYSDGMFSFSRDWYYTPPYGYGDKFISRGTLKLGVDGKGKISEVLDLEKMFKNKDDRQSRIIVFDITVKNGQGQSVSSQKSFLLHAGEFYIAAAAEKPFVGVKESTNLKVKTTDIKGKEMRVNDIVMSVSKVDWVYNKRQEADGGYSYKWEEKREFVKDYKFSTDNNGNYTQNLSFDKEGQYIIEPSAKDGKGNTVFANYYIYVYGEGNVSVKPSNDTTLDLAVDKTNLKVGDEGRVIIKSPYEKAKALISIDRGKVFEYYIKDIVGNLSEFTFSVREEYTPNVYVSVLLISSKPEIKYGDVEFQINTERKNLNISVKPNKPAYLPGEEVILDISSKDYAGRGVQAELSVSVVDLSVLALSGNPKQNPLLFFYGGFPLTVSTSSNLKDILQEVEIKTKGGGGAGELFSAQAKDNALSTKKRGEFRENAYWNAQVTTNDNGIAQIKFTLPDNLTKWQAETVGVTKDTRVGAGYAEFMSKKLLMAVPLKPRFAIPSDNFYVGAQVFNQSDSDQKVAVSYSSKNLPLDKESNSRTIKLGPGKSETVYFRVNVPVDYKDSSVDFEIFAKGQNLEDAVSQAIKINQNSTYEATATAGYTNAEKWTEYLFLPPNILKDRGGLTVKSSATLATFLSDSLNYMMQYPYGCAEQMASKLKAIAIVKRGLALPNIFDKFNLQKIKYEDKEYTPDEIVQIGLSKIYNQQNYDGGFSYWEGGQSNYYLTVYLIEVFGDLQRAKYDVNKDALDKAIKFVWQKLTTDREFINKNDVAISTLYAIESLPSDSTTSQILAGEENFLSPIVNDASYINDKINTDTLAKLAMVLYLSNYSDTSIVNKISNTLDNRLEIDSRGAFLSQSENFSWFDYETAIKNTALYLKFNSLKKSDNSILDKVVRWILNSKQKDGSWGSTNETTAVIDSLTEYLAWKRETESNFSLDILVNKTKNETIDVSPETVLNQFEKTWPLSAFKFNENNAFSFEKTDRNNLPNNFYYDMVLKYYLQTDQIGPRDEGFTISRNFYKVDDKENKNPVLKGKVGEVLKEHIEITVPKTRRFVAIEDFIPAGMEIVNLDLATEQKSLTITGQSDNSQIEKAYYPETAMNFDEGNIYDYTLYPDFKELRDDRAFIYKELLNPGVYRYDYYVRPLVKGKFNYLPAVVSEMYFPENFGRTDGRYFEIE